MTRKRNNIKKDKRASAQDIIYIIVVLFALGLGLLVYFTIGSKFNEKIQTMNEVPELSKNASAKTIGYYTSTVDKAVPFILVMMCIIMIVMSMMVSIHPAFVVLFFIVWITGVVLSVILSDAYEMISTTEMLTNYSTQLTMTNFTIKLLPWITGVMGMILMAVMYKGKKYNEPT